MIRGVARTARVRTNTAVITMLTFIVDSLALRIAVGVHAGRSRDVGDAEAVPVACVDHALGYDLGRNSGCVTSLHAPVLATVLTIEG